MICANFSGNMADSLVQYIITRIVAHRNGYKFGFNPKFHYDYHNGANQLSFLNLDYGEKYDCGFDESPHGVSNVWHEKFIPYNYDNGDHNDYHPFDPSIFQIEDNTRLILRWARDYKYFEGYEKKIKEWTNINPEFEKQCETYLGQLFDLDDDNLCIINYRGGEFTTVSNLLIKPQYYNMAIMEMIRKNPSIYFIVITDDPNYAQNIFPNLQCFHFGIGPDYYVIKNAKNLILSNSGFPVIPTLTNEKVKNIIAPKYWARWNVSNGYWCPGEMYYPGWEYMDRDGKVFTYKQIYNEQFLKGLR
jgi:hypothetical protein